MGRFGGKVVLVTGGTSGIGRATAIAFARERARVIVTGRRPDAGAETVTLARAAGGDAEFMHNDVTRPAEIESLFGQILGKYGRLDCAFNNAGVEGKLGPLAEQTDENYDAIFNANVRGLWHCMKHEIPAMVQAGGGAIVNNSSIAGVIGAPGAGLYSASKHAVLGLTRSAAIEYAQNGVRINAVCPAAIETDMFDRFTGSDEVRSKFASMHPIGRIGRPEEIAEAVLWLCSPESSFVVGHPLLVDGGFTAR